MAQASGRAARARRNQSSLFTAEQLVAIPDTGWRTPCEWPSLAGAEAISLDLETYDPDLTTKGPGWAAGRGHIVGVAIGVPDGRRWYFPMRHEVGGRNLDPRMVLEWCRDELSRPGQLKIGANLMYDLGWLLREGVKVEGPFYDVQWVEALLDEHRDHYSLDSIAKDRLSEGKVSSELYDWCARAYGGKATARAQGCNIYRAPAALVGPYAESDVDLPLRIRQQQLKELETDGLTGLSDMEHKLMPLLLRMRLNGVKISQSGAEQANDDMGRWLDEAQLELNKAAGRVIQAGSAADLAPMFQKVGVTCPTTKTGLPSVTKPWLENCKHPLAEQVLNVRKWGKMRGTFVQGYLLDQSVNGRIHCELHPLRSDDGGTVSGRFSSSNPNLQNIPSRDKLMKKILRGAFIPEDGHIWGSLDYSQIEYRLLVHAAGGPAGAMARKRYNEDPKTDYHEFTSQLVKGVLGRELERKPVKNINFGTIFGMGNAKLQSMLGLERREAEEFFQAYNDAIPYALETRERAGETAGRTGVIKTIMGRRARFPFWEARDWDTSQRDGYMTHSEAVTMYGESHIRRARTHKALNSYTQGGGADIMKRSMVDTYEAGIYDVLVPLLTVHDEMNVSMPRTVEAYEALLEMKRLMEASCPDLRVPLIADVEIGANWGCLEEWNGKTFC